MNFRVTCECGQSLPVTAGEAGSQKTCSCGRAIRVPTLGALARATGNPLATLATLTAVERVRYLLDAGRLPAGASCVRCGFPTDAALDCSVECERPYAPSRSRWWIVTILLAIIWPAAAIFRAFFRDEYTGEVHGRELVVKTPIRMCPECQQFFRGGARASELRKLLCSVSEYEALFQAFPQATAAARPLRSTAKV